MPWTWYLLMLVAAGAALFVGNTVASWLAGVVRAWLERTGLDPSIRRIVVQAIHPLVLAIAVVAALGYLGADMTGLVAVLGAATLAVGLALKGSLSNLASGAILVTLRPYREGDFVQLAGQSGTVVEMGLYATVLRSPQGVLTTLPNDLVVSKDIHNFTRGGTRRIDVTVTVGYDADLAASLQALEEVITGDARVLSDPAPQVVVDSLGPRGVSLVARAWVANADFGAARSDLHRGAIEALRTAQVPVARPLVAVGEA